MGVLLLAILATLAPAPADDAITQDRLNRFMFFAVLEGLMEDAVPDRTVKGLLEQDAKGAQLNFVYGCGLCTPTLEAMRLHLDRGDKIHYSRKGDPYLGVPGLPAALAAQLDADDAATRRKGLEALVERYVERRMKRLRLTDSEKEPWLRTIALAKKKAMDLIDTSGLKECPTCLGSANVR